jgi:hypothetical protein
VARPAELAAHPALREPLELLLPKARREAFTESSGVSLAGLPSALVAGFDYATLYAAKLEGSGSVIDERFTERLVGGPRTASPHPKIRRVSGVVGRSPQTLVLIEDELVALSSGSSIPAQVAIQFALGRLKRSPPALEGAALSTLPANLTQAPLVFYAPGPFHGEWAEGAQGLLAGATAVGITVTPAADGALKAVILIAGDWSTLGPDAADHLLTAWESLATSNLGRLLGWVEPAEKPLASATPELLRLSVAVNALPLAQGLRAAVAAEVWEILDIPKPGAAPPRKRTPAEGPPLP